MEDILDLLKVPSELFSPDTNEVVPVFIGVVLNSRYANDNLISRRLNILFTKKWGPHVLAHGVIMWIYAEFYYCTNSKWVSDSSLAHSRAAP